jgi:hypothetical protein
VAVAAVRLQAEMQLVQQVEQILVAAAAVLPRMVDLV